MYFFISYQRIHEFLKLMCFLVFGLIRKSYVSGNVKWAGSLCDYATVATFPYICLCLNQDDGTDFLSAAVTWAFFWSWDGLNFGLGIFWRTWSQAYLGGWNSVGPLELIPSINGDLWLVCPIFLFPFARDSNSQNNQKKVSSNSKCRINLDIGLYLFIFLL